MSVASGEYDKAEETEVVVKQPKKKVRDLLNKSGIGMRKDSKM